MTELIYPEGLDSMWLASDQDGRVALFTSAGCGPIPMSFLAALKKKSVVDIEPLIWAMPVVSRVDSLEPAYSQLDSVSLGERGFFVYDWIDFSNAASFEDVGYQLVVVPDPPLDIESLADPLFAIAHATSAGRSFESLSRWDFRESVECLSGEGFRA